MGIRDLSKQGIIAALYVASCIIFAPISFGAIQCRISELLMVLAFYDRKNAIGLTIGCLLANMFSPLGIIDIIFGTAGTLIVGLVFSAMNSKKLLAVTAALINGVIIGAELNFIMGMPFVMACITVGIGEFIAVQVGVLAFSLLERQALLKL